MKFSIMVLWTPLNDFRVRPTLKKVKVMAEVKVKWPLNEKSISSYILDIRLILKLMMSRSNFTNKHAL